MRSSARLEHPLPPIVALADTQRQIADALHTHETVSAGQPVASLQLGAVSLHPQQRATAQHLRTIIARHGGALLADDVGTGKTFVALDVASEYDMVHVIAPATLLPMWRSAIQRTIGRRAHLHSLQRFSRTPRHRIAEGPGTLVIIDEAHQLRNTNTTRYRTIAHAIAGAHTLLLSATPLHNNSDELRTLCALFTHNLHNDLIVRRTLAQPTQAPRPAGLPGKPVVREHRSAGAPQDSRTLELILSLPAPLPTHEGAAASALIRLGLLRAWCSSDAALAGALRQRQLRGQAMQDALQTGRHPTSRELQSWIVGDSGGQLGFPELLATHHADCDALIPTLERHLDAIAELARHHARSATGDACRAALLKRIMRKHHDVPVIAFSQFERTAVALHRALRNTPGIGLLTSTQGRIASGPIAREELLALFAPRAQGKPPPPPHQAVRLLLATDLLAEGVNLQDAGVVVHLDLPWTDALLRQRVGRSARLGSPHHTVHVYRLRASVAASRALRAEARIAEKARLAIRHVTGTRHRPGRADTVARLLDATISWSHADSDTRGPLPASHSGDQPMTLSVCHRL
ncbi:MAG TPA: DEAD/DEAH box helicase, partial [Gemmatimonas sp.]|uniref:DEAD/DEAH box helicase n=1 Tax=Gemmatimonas sp. TaxID=1962908 RepID=UPI002EDA26D0